MPMFPVKAFKCSWHPGSNSGGVSVQLSNGAVIDIKVQDGGEFAALLAILNEPNVWLNTDNHTIGTGGPVGGT